jgi:membrane-associated protein
MNTFLDLFDANSVVSTLGLVGVLAIIFMETGLLIGLVFPGGEVVFLAGMAASGAGANVLGEAKLSAPLLFILAPIAAIVGGEVGYWFGKTYGRKFIGRFIPFGRTLINPICGVVQLDRKTFSTWNAIGAIIWTQVAIGIGYLLGDALSTRANTYLYGVVAVILLITGLPMVLEVFKEWRTKRHLS